MCTQGGGKVKCTQEGGKVKCTQGGGKVKEGVKSRRG